MALLNFNARNVEPQQDYSPIPSGHYLASIIDSDMKPTKKNDGQFLELTYAVQEGEHKGRKVWVRLNLDNPSTKAVDIANRQLSSICRAVGVMDCRDSSQLHNRPHVIRVEYVKADGQYSQRDTNEVKEWKQAEGVAQMPQQAAAAPNTATEAPPWARSA